MASSLVIDALNMAACERRNRLRWHYAPGDSRSDDPTGRSQPNEPPSSFCSDPPQSRRCRRLRHRLPRRGEPAPLPPLPRRLSGPASASRYLTSNRIGADTAAFFGSAMVIDPDQAPIMLNRSLAP